MSTGGAGHGSEARAPSSTSSSAAWGSGGHGGGDAAGAGGSALPVLWPSQCSLVDYLSADERYLEALAQVW
jgi:hypothetical protein